MPCVAMWWSTSGYLAGVAVASELVEMVLGRRRRVPTVYGARLLNWTRVACRRRLGKAVAWSDDVDVSSRRNEQGSDAGWWVLAQVPDSGADT